MNYIIILVSWCLGVLVAELLRKKITTNNRQLADSAGGIYYDNSKKN